MALQQGPDPSALFSPAIDEGGEGPVIVLMHGLAGCKELWRETLEPLRRSGYRAIAFDHRGHGESPDIPSPWSIGDLATDLLHLLDRLDLEKVCLVGHSMGGRAMFAFAIDHPDRVTGLVAVGAQSEAPRAVYRDILCGVRDATRRDGIDGFRRAFEAAGEIPDRVRTDQVYGQSFNRWFDRNRPAMIEAALGAILTMPALTPLLPQIRVPMLAVVGDGDEHFLELANHYARVMPDCRTSIVANTGHYPMVDAPVAFMHTLLGFASQSLHDA
jgi:pimeloyl-ACP methyl ester carboxylesterase